MDRHEYEGETERNEGGFGETYLAVLCTDAFRQTHRRVPSQRDSLKVDREFNGNLTAEKARGLTINCLSISTGAKG
jgi:hypothetical protein